MQLGLYPLIPLPLRAYVGHVGLEIIQSGSPLLDSPFHYDFQVPHLLLQLHYGIPSSMVPTKHMDLEDMESLFNPIIGEGVLCSVSSAAGGATTRYVMSASAVKVVIFFLMVMMLKQLPTIVGVCSGAVRS